MRWVVVVVLVVHGLLHLMGVAKAFGLAELRQLTLPISRPMGLLWLGAAVLVLASAVALALDARWFWVVGVCAIVASQAVILSAWSDARFGTLANLVALLAVVSGFASRGPFSLRSEYGQAVRVGLASSPRAAAVTEADLERLPAPVQRYVRLSGAVGQPQVTDFRATWNGRIRGGVSEPWMVFRAEQYNFFAAPPARLFFMDATMKGLPVDIFHRFIDDSATFRVRLLSAFTMVDAKGPEMNRSETVTLFNDLAILAPGRLIDPSIHWDPIDARRARARYSRGSETISAELVFNDEGELVDFVTDDRLAASKDGKSFTLQRWTTPVRNYRSFGPRRVGTFGEARWEPPSGAFTYIELELVNIEYNVAGRAATYPPPSFGPSPS